MSEDFIEPIESPKEPEVKEGTILRDSKNNQLKATLDIIKIINMPRKARRIIARQNGYKNIPSIVNIQLKKAPAPSFVEPEDKV